MLWMVNRSNLVNYIWLKITLFTLSVEALSRYESNTLEMSYTHHNEHYIYIMVSAMPDILDAAYQKYPELVSFLTAETPEQIAEKFTALKKEYWVPLSKKKPMSVLVICSLFGKEQQLDFLLKQRDQEEHMSWAITVAVIQEFPEIAMRILERMKDTIQLRDIASVLICQSSKKQYSELLERLLTFDSIKDGVANNGNKALYEAIVTDDKALINTLLTLPTVTAALEDNNCAISILAEAVHSSNQALFTRLLGYPSVKAVVAANDNHIFRLALGLHLVDMAKQLLTYPTVLARAEMDTTEQVQAIVRPYIDEKLSDLMTQKEAFVSDQSGRSFDINEADVEAYCYILRNLIRRNDVACSQSIGQLLKLPSLVQRLNNPEAGSQLLEMALEGGDEATATVLLNLPDVRASVEAAAATGRDVLV